MKRTVIIGVSITGLVLAGVAVWFGGGYAVYRIRASSYDPPIRYGLARVHPEFGPGLPTDVGTARVFDGGDLQVVAQVGVCGAISELKVRETASEVHVAVRAAGLPGDCPAMSIGVWVNVPLDTPLGDRALIDDKTDRKVAVELCSTDRIDRRDACGPGAYGTAGIAS